MNLLTKILAYLVGTNGLHAHTVDPSGIVHTSLSEPHRCRRERMPQEGVLVQIDGSYHNWLESRGPWLTLLFAVDDATGTIPWALFSEREDAKGYFRLLWGITQVRGSPGSKGI